MRWLVNLMLLGGGVVAVPLALTLYFYIALDGTFVGAVALAKTEGLEVGTFTGGYWVAILLGMAGLVTGLVLRFKWRDSERLQVMRVLARPSVALLLLFFVPASLLTLLELGEVDVPDILSTTAIVGSIGYLWLIFPFALGGGAWRLLQGLRRWALEQAHRAQLVLVGTPVALLVSASLLFGGVVLGVDMFEDDSGRVLDQHFEQLAEDEVDGPAELLHGILVAANEANEASLDEVAMAGAPEQPPSAFGTADRQRRFQECFEELMAPEATGRSPLETAVVRLRRSMNDEEAYDVAAQKLLDVCEKHAAESYRNLTEVYAKAITNARNDYVGKRKRRGDLEERFGRRDPRTTRLDWESRDFIKKCMAELSYTHRRTLSLMLSSPEYDDLARKMGVTESTARKRVSRAQQAARKKCSSL
jgi:DNA-directed RNA polymerase specialized sigma24 family protein